MDFISTALDMAISFHGGQEDKNGKPFVMHPIRVATSLGPDTEEEIVAAALLHDVVEDTFASLETLRRADMTDRIVEIVDALTRREQEVYRDYLHRLSQNNDAVIIKIADIRDNMDLRRGVSSEILSLIEGRYIPALKYLNRIRQENELTRLFYEYQ